MLKSSLFYISLRIREISDKVIRKILGFFFKGKSQTCHCFYDNSEISFSVSQGNITPSLVQVSNSLEVGPSWLCKLCGMGYRKNNTTGYGQGD